MSSDTLSTEISPLSLITCFFTDFISFSAAASAASAAILLAIALSCVSLRFACTRGGGGERSEQTAGVGR